MIYSKSGDIPTHQYCYVEQSYITNGEMSGTEPCVWFGIVAYTGRVWGCQIMLRSGAVYREVPIHALSYGYQSPTFAHAAAEEAASEFAADKKTGASSLCRCPNKNSWQCSKSLTLLGENHELN